MACFWQLTGPDSHFERRWNRGDPNQNIANAVFGHSPVKGESGEAGGLTLTVGIKEDGSSHILVPNSMSYLCSSLSRWKKYPYSPSEFASLSPIRVETPERLFVLLNERQNQARVTKAKKERRDVSKANGKFCGGPRNLTRAKFEHARTFWHILTRNHADATIYGLPYPWWIQSVSILSFAFSFWRPDGSGRVSVDHLLLASITELDVSSKEQGQSWCFRIEENSGLQNADELESSISGVSITLPHKEAVKRLQDRLFAAATRGPVVVLLHGFGAAERDQLSSLGFDVSKWIDGLGPLLGYNDLKDSDGSNSKNEEIARRKREEEPSKWQNRSKARSRSSSPRRVNGSSGSNYRTFEAEKDSKYHFDEKLKRASTPSMDVLSPFYVVSITEFYKAVTGKHWERVLPHVVFTTLTGNGQHSETGAIPRNVDLDSTHIMQAWLAMVRGPFIDEQTALLENQTRNSATRPSGNPNGDGAQNDASRELEGLHSAAPRPRQFVDIFNDNSDSDWEG